MLYYAKWASKPESHMKQAEVQNRTEISEYSPAQENCDRMAWHSSQPPPICGFFLHRFLIQCSPVSSEMALYAYGTRTSVLLRSWLHLEWKSWYQRGSSCVSLALKRYALWKEDFCCFNSKRRGYCCWVADRVCQGYYVPNYLTGQAIDDRTYECLSLSKTRGLKLLKAGRSLG